MLSSHDPKYYTASDWLGTGQKHAIQGDHRVLKTPYRENSVLESHDPTYYTTSDWLGPGKVYNAILVYRETTVLRKHNTGRALCLDPMIQHIILPQIDLAQDKIENNAIQGDHCVLKTPYRETTVFGSNDPQYYITSDWLGPGTDQQLTPYIETTVF